VIGRRRFLLGAAGLAAGAMAIGACGSDGDGGASEDAGSPSRPAATSGGMPSGQSSTDVVATSSGTSSGQAKSGVPAYVPFGGVKPDLPPDAGGVPPAFYHYPATAPASISGPIGGGGTVSVMLEGTVPPHAVDKNPWWQGLNQALGVDLKLNTIPFADYAQKFQVVTAGGDLPDLLQIDAGIAHAPDILDKEFADLTEYLSGDAVKEYAGLASIPTAAWQVTTINGRIWGVPQARPAAGSVLCYRGDVAEKYGLSIDVKSGQDFLALCKELSDPDHNRFAFGQQPNTWTLSGILEMMEAPNGWSEQDGQFTSVNQAPQMKDALDVVRTMWKSGYLHPASFTTPNQMFPWWQAGTTMLYYMNVAQWPKWVQTYSSFKIGLIKQPKWDGGGLAAKALGAPAYGAFGGMKKASPDRVKEMLRILNFIAAPFGSKEYLLSNYGVLGHDYTLQGSDPVYAKAADGEMGLGNQNNLVYFGSQAYYTIYLPGEDALAKMVHDYFGEVLPTGVPDPSRGLYSETAGTAGAAAGKKLSDIESDIIQGRKDVSAWDSAVTTWLKEAGSQIAKEYEEAYAKSH
jgi:putative aldouronate transport system substrate-binding protein